MEEENKVEEVTEETKEVETPVVEEPKEEIKEDTSITATDNEGNTVSEAKNISQNEPKSEEVKKPEEEPKKEEPKEDTLKVAFIDQQKQLEETQSQLDGLKKANEELLNKNKELVEKVEKFEKDISELRESPFYKSTVTSADRKVTNKYEGLTAEDLKAFHRGI